MNNPKKIKAFTIIELIIGMVLIGIIASISISSISGFNANIFNYQRKSSKINRIIQFKELIKYEFQNAIKVTKINSGFEISNYNGSVQYIFSDNKLYRYQNNTEDYFELEITSLKTLYENQTELIPGNMLDEIVVNVSLNQPFILRLKRENSLADQINHEIFENGN